MVVYGEPAFNRTIFGIEILITLLLRPPFNFLLIAPSLELKFCFYRLCDLLCCLLIAPSLELKLILEGKNMMLYILLIAPSLELKSVCVG